MSVHSLALRDRVVRAIEKKRGNIDEIADLFEVSRSSVRRWLRLKQETGKIEPRLCGGGKASTVDLDRIRALVEEKPERRSFEVAAAHSRFVPKSRRVHRSSIQRASARCGYVLKKNVPGRQSTTDLRFAKRDSDSRHG